MSEPLDLKNIIEVEEIRKLLISHPDLLSLFEMVIIIANNRINEEKQSKDPPLEDNVEPDLSDHESDDEDT
tara:strand:- start:613 stop:825 length:213 start_codon:yes stop_codon:yes gene_type:complete